ncbi:MAG: hypothetical protein JSR59_20360 [Proteobacteria bacterium]|nr:hypothetical protein [Pseudomonadota bacterium]
MASFMRWRRLAAWSLSAMLAACGGGGGQPAQTPVEQPSLTGIAMDGAAVYTGSLIAKGAGGTQRTSAPFGGTDDYSIVVQDLTAPYMLSFGVDGVTVAIAAGHANVTALTTLLTSALLGQDAQTAFTSYGATSTALSARITEAGIASAQADVTAFLEQTVGVTVKTGTQSFITTPFAATAGDPMYDTLTALDARIAALGSDAYDAMVASFVNEEHLCIEGRLDLTVDGTAVRFCPARRTSDPEDADPTVLDDVYTTTGGDVLALRVRDQAVLSASYATSAGASYACSGTACSGITVGAAATDLTRVITFDAAPLTGGGGTVVIDGALATAVPGVVLPSLPCSDNRYFLIQPDRSVIADCVDISDGANTFGIAATFVTAQGSTTYGTYPFRNVTGSNGLAPVAQPTTVSVVLNGGTFVSVTATRQTFDENGLPTGYDIDYKCRAGACNGVTVGPPTINTDFGFTAEIRTITFDGTQLAAVASDGSLSTTTFATLKATFTGIYISAMDTGTFFPVLASDCGSLSNQVDVTPADEPYTFGSCADLIGGVIGATQQADGSLVLTMNNFGAGDVTVNTDAGGAVVSATIAYSFGESFGCMGDCGGVAVSAPDGTGQRTVTFTGSVLHIVEADGYPTGARTATASGSFVVPAPTPAALRASRRP